MCAICPPDVAPRARHGEIQRTRLLARLRARTEPIVVMSAPAGYGKTIVAAQMCERDKRPSAWCALRESDNDPLALVNHIVAALAHIGPIADEYLSACRNPTPRGEPHLLLGLGDCMRALPPFLLIVDDVHLVTGSRSMAVLRDVARMVPPGCQVLMATRTDPQIGLARLRLVQQLAEFKAGDLALDPNEIRLYLHSSGVSYDKAAVAELNRITEGWPAGVALATLSLDTPRLTGEALSRISGAEHNIADFLFDEVLARQDPSIRTFLIESSVCQRLSTSLCDEMLERKGSAQRLREIESKNLFVTAMDERHEWYRYHHLFREMLAAELDRTDRERARVLLQRAAAWHERNGAPDEAFEYARRSGDFQLAGRVLLRNWQEYVHYGRLESLKLWLEGCRDGQIESDTALSIGAGWVFAQLGDAVRAERYLAAAERARDLDQPSPDGATNLRVAMVNLRSAMGSRGVSQMLDDGHFVYKSERSHRTSWLLGGCRAIGVAAVLLGKTPEAIRALQEALALTQNHGELSCVRLMCLGYLALAHIEQAEWARATEAIGEADVLIDRLEMSDTVHALPAQTANAQMLVQTNQLEAVNAALEAVSRNLYLASARPWLMADSASRCAEVAFQVADEDGAGHLTDIAVNALRRLPDAGIVSGRVEALLARLERSTGRLASLTITEMRVLRELTSHRTLRQIADELFVSRSTVKNHVASIYRKLGVASRSDAVEYLGGWMWSEPGGECERVPDPHLLRKC